MGEEKRHQMMQNLFGDQSEDEEDENESENEPTRRRSDYPSDEGEGEAEFEGEGEAEVEGQGEADVESEGEPHEIEPDGGESEGERAQSSPEKEISDQRVESDGKEEAESEEQDDYDPRVATSRRREVIVSGSERSDENHYAENEDEEVDRGKETAESEEQEEYGQRMTTGRRREVIASDSEGSDDNQYVDNEDEEVNQSRLRQSPSEEVEKNQALTQPTAEIRDVFGDSDEDEPEEYAAPNIRKQESYRSYMEEEENGDQGMQPEDMVPDEDMRYESEEDNVDQKQKEKPVGPPLELEIPLRPPASQPDKMNLIRVSNIMGIEPKPFDPKTYVEEDVFVTDESGTKKRIRLEDNIVRWRSVRNRDGTKSFESNARFVRWSDGSLQLLIGNEVLDISVQEAQHDQTHLFLRHGKGILQSQGRLLKKMRFMPSSLSSKSHRLLTALVDSRHKKVYKVKNCITDMDPEKEKEEKEKAEGQTIRANELLHRKREKVNRKYSQTVERGRQLSPGFLEEALEEDDEPEDYHTPHRSRRRFEEDFEEAQAEKRIMNAKRSQIPKNIRSKSSLPAVRSSRRPLEESSESEREESEYESTGDEDERLPSRKRSDEPEYRDEDESEQEAEEIDANEASEEDEDEEPRHRSKESKGSIKRKGIESDSDSSPRRRTTHRRRAVVYDSEED